jgi:hypothetical protein
METDIVAVRLADGTQIFAEVEAENGLRGAAAVGGRDARDLDFKGALANVRSAAVELLDTVRSIAEPPDECEITFGIKLNAQAGAIIAKASAEANFTVKLQWSRRSAE